MATLEIASALPSTRIRRLGDARPRPRGDAVLYWMTAARRATHSFALQRAVEIANALGKPLWVLEPLRVDYRWACDRFHRFVIDGMAANREAFDHAGVTYYPYVEPSRGAAKGLVESLAAHAAYVVTDDWPCFFLRGLPDKVAARLDVALEAVDGNGLLPLAEGERVFTRAFSFRIHLHKRLPAELARLAVPEPLADLRAEKAAPLPPSVAASWPASHGLLDAPGDLSALPIDHRIAPHSALAGGAVAAQERLSAFLDGPLADYGSGRNHPDDDGASGLSPWLHFGHVAAQDVLLALAEREGWTPDRLSASTSGKRAGWWGMSEGAESFLDELVTWREIGHNMCHHRADYDQLTSLPDWALTTIAEHAEDERPELYSLAQLAAAETADPIWNAAQRQLVIEGRMHNYLRMLWAKKIYQWSEDVDAALYALIELNNRYATDGRDPNSYSGIFWTLGRYDRAWGPERPIFGKLRYMTSDSTRRKLRLKSYLQRYGDKMTRGASKGASVVEPNGQAGLGF